MRVAGCDPGKHGAIVVLGCPDHDLEGYGASYKLRYNKVGQLEIYPLLSFLERTKPGLICLEKVQGRGGMGATQTFNFGFACGELGFCLRSHAINEDVPMHYPSPQQWQKVMHEGIPAKLDAKARSRAAYDQLFPHQPIPVSKSGKVDDNIVDALLIATFGVLKYGHGGLRRWNLEPWSGP